MTKHKSDVEKQVENTTAGGHLGGTYYGQTKDAKDSDTNKKGDKARPNDGDT
ncbi:hypothetical protein [Tianweitania sediminis]|jgi:hypothetical protein|uniref:Uncharacterized protein n=1 Tax=Tianweitania sediminis TaxID=1502156 RepID=A0A8J7QYG1_9HYPH|nr:hypothetical protein [Tianweitania sediminis]MBP0437537.1 hypothetical protein [Tianweitania sediminis]HEV7415589.1 hypothetical protein [Tianweitania sediminis]